MISTPLLELCLKSYDNQITEFTDLRKQLQALVKNKEEKELISFYDKVYLLIEKLLWSDRLNILDFNTLLKIYQNLFKEQEKLYQLDANNLEEDKRKNFIISVPIADRPEHLRACIESIYQLCKLYNYGGKAVNGIQFYSKVKVIIIEDSKDLQCIKDDIKIAEDYCLKGLKVYHYGLDEQYQLMHHIPQDIRSQVRSLIGTPSTEKFYHKGQAVTRNLGYLKALQISSDDIDNSLYFFVDSDQLFQVNRTTETGDELVYGLNYFYYINKIFSENKLEILTGKYIGDPPVSPSVMTVNFLDDVIAFFTQLSQYSSHQDCQFHPQTRVKPGDAAYHDMGQLFGYDNNNVTFDYCCPLTSQDTRDNNEIHNHIDCLKKFSEHINYFFFGEHLTRKTYFNFDNKPFTDINLARTIYPGNYIATFKGLKYCIPFGELRLRMSGPTTGRLIQSELKDKFSSSNLPMLHTRTVKSNSKSDNNSVFKNEFRPGVEDNAEIIDLTDEFERQFFGDLMLFTVAKLSKDGLICEQYSHQNLTETFSIVEKELLDLYDKKHQTVQQKNRILSNLVNEQNQWWNQSEDHIQSVAEIHKFINNINFNFDTQSLVYQHIQSKQYRHGKTKLMIKALLNYKHDRDAWGKMLKTIFS